MLKRQGGEPPRRRGGGGRAPGPPGSPRPSHVGPPSRRPRASLGSAASSRWPPSGRRRPHEGGHVKEGAGGAPPPRKPNVVEADGWSEPLYETFVTDAVEPLVLSVPFQTWLIDWPSLRFH